MSETPRDKTPERPYMWASKTALRKIRDASFDRHAIVRAAYLALCEIASDEQAATFRASHTYIANRAGISRKSIQRAVKELTSLGLVITQNLGPKHIGNKYRILTMRKVASMVPMPTAIASQTIDV